MLNLIGSKRYGTVMERIERDTFYEPNCGCWLFAGPVDERGYGRVRIGKKKVRVHNFTFQKDTMNPTSDDQVVMHSCDMPCCWNPDHLSAGTGCRQYRRIWTKKDAVLYVMLRYFTEDEVREIRIAKGSFRSTSAVVNTEFSHHTISDIQRGLSWKYLP